MVLAAFLPLPLSRHFRSVLPEEYEILEARSWAELSDSIRRRPVDSVVVDPFWGGNFQVDEITNLIERYPSLPILVYTTLTPGALKAAGELSRRGIHQIVIHRFDDSATRFREILDRTPGYHLGRGLLDALAQALELLPAQLGRAVEQMFERPHLFAGALDLVIASGVPASRLYRKFQSVGLKSPHRLFIAARLLRGYAYMQEPGYSIEDIAAKLGYNHTRTFTRHVMLAMEMKPRELRTALRANEVISRLLEWIYEGDGDGTESRGAGKC